jgi:apolipoprotein N-acyltransferase
MIYFISALCGYFLTWAFPTNNVFFLAWCALIPFFYFVFTENSIKRLVLASICFAVPFYSVLISGFSVLQDVVPGGVIPAAMVVLIAAQAFFIVILVVLFKIMQRAQILEGFGKNLLDVGTLTALWVVFDWLRSLGTFGNTIGGLAYSQYLNIVFIQLAKFSGPYGLTLVLVLSNALIALLLKDIFLRKKEYIIPWAWTLMIVVVVMTIGQYVLTREISATGEPPEATKKIAIYQPAIPQNIKLDFDKHAELKQMYLHSLRAFSQLRTVDLIILPETIVPEFLLNNKEFLFNLRDAIESTLIFGTPRFRNRSVDDRYFNSVVLMNKYGDMTVLHDKKYLVPFGEYLPYRSFFTWVITATGFFESEYSKGETNASVAGYGTAVCFESTLPYQLREQTRTGAKLLFVITNDAWYKQTTILDIHLSCAVLRAVENNRYLIQAANNGYSAIIDNKGRIQKISEIDENGWVEGDAKLYTDRTVYTIFGEIAVYAAWIYLLLIMYLMLLKYPERLLAKISLK